jgi:hypothetical protein
MMTVEEKIAELRRNIQTGGVEFRVLPEVRAKLDDIAKRAAELCAEMLTIADAEAMRLASSPEEANAILQALSMYSLRTQSEWALQVTPELAAAPSENGDDPNANDRDDVLSASQLSEG